MILSAAAKPYAFSFDPAKTALLLSQLASMLPSHSNKEIVVTSIAFSVDFQRDFLEDGGFGEIQGGNLTAVQASIGPASAVLKLARRAGLTVVHTREGHDPTLRDCPTAKVCLKRSYSDESQQTLIFIAYATSQCSGFKAYRGNRRNGA
jgi:hypothetical protein